MLFFWNLKSRFFEIWKFHFQIFFENCALLFFGKRTWNLPYFCVVPGRFRNFVGTYALRTGTVCASEHQVPRKIRSVAAVVQLSLDPPLRWNGRPDAVHGTTINSRDLVGFEPDKRPSPTTRITQRLLRYHFNGRVKYSDGCINTFKHCFPPTSAR